MSQDQRRQFAVVVSFVITLAINVAANALPINGQRTAEISDRFDVFVIPAGYVFSIWGLIYLLLAAFTIDQARPARSADPTLRRLGWLPVAAGLLNALWVVLFQYEWFGATVPVMVGLLVTLIWINAITFADRERLTGAGRWTVRLTFSVYLGWITIATIANVAQALQAVGVSVDPAVAPIIAAAVLIVGVAIALAFVWRFADVAYGAVVVWAYVGVAVKEAGTPVVAGTALAGAILVAGLAIATIVGRRAPTASTMIGVEPSIP
jgi:benzodiazapine receptor